MSHYDRKDVALCLKMSPLLPWGCQFRGFVSKAQSELMRPLLRDCFQRSVFKYPLDFSGSSTVGQRGSRAFERCRSCENPLDIKKSYDKMECGQNNSIDWDCGLFSKVNCPPVRNGFFDFERFLLGFLEVASRQNPLPPSSSHILSSFSLNLEKSGETGLNII